MTGVDQSTGKADDAFRTIGEMAEELGVKPHILRYWEEQFPMLDPLKRAGGRRHYRSEDAALLRQIQSLLQDQGFTIKGARRHLSSTGSAQSPQNGPGEETASASRADRHQSHIFAAKEKRPAIEDQALSVLRSIRDRLTRAVDSA